MVGGRCPAACRFAGASPGDAADHQTPDRSSHGPNPHAKAEKSPPFLQYVGIPAWKYQSSRGVLLHSDTQESFFPFGRSAGGRRISRQGAGRKGDRALWGVIRLTRRPGPLTGSHEGRHAISRPGALVARVAAMHGRTSLSLTPVSDLQPTPIRPDAGLDPSANPDDSGPRARMAGGVLNPEFGDCRKGLLP